MKGNKKKWGKYIFFPQLVKYAYNKQQKNCLKIQQHFVFKISPLFDVAGVHDVHDPVDGHGGLSDVGRDHDLSEPPLRRPKHAQLPVWRQCTVHR